MTTMTVNEIPLARRVGRAQGDIDRGAMLKGNYMLVPSGRNVLAYKLEAVEQAACCPDAKAGNPCRHALALQLLRGVKVHFGNEALKKLAEAEEAVVKAGGWQAAPQDLRLQAGQLAAEAAGVPFVNFGELPRGQGRRRVVVVA